MKNLIMTSAILIIFGCTHTPPPEPELMGPEECIDLAGQTDRTGFAVYDFIYVCMEMEAEDGI